jgi:hypothetical protein
MEVITVKRLIACFSLVFLFAVPAFTQGKPSKIPIVFSCTCEDVAAAEYASAMRDLLATSPRYREIYKTVELNANGQVTVKHFHILVVSLDPFAGKAALEGNSSVLAVAFVMGDDYFLDLYEETTNLTAAKQSAVNTLASLDKMIADAQAAAAKQ